MKEGVPAVALKGCDGGKIHLQTSGMGLPGERLIGFDEPLRCFFAVALRQSDVVSALKDDEGAHALLAPDVTVEAL